MNNDWTVLRDELERVRAKYEAEKDSVFFQGVAAGIKYCIGMLEIHHGVYR